MRSYTEASRFPLVNMSGVPVPRLILGHLPFIGESYQGPEKNREYAERFSDVENTVRVLSRAVVGYGVTVAAAVPAGEGRLAGLFLEAVQETMRRTGVEIALIPCLRIPLTIRKEPIDDYRRWLTYYEVERRRAMEGVLEKYLEDPILQCREGWKWKFEHALVHSHAYGKMDIEKLQINYEELRQGLSSLEDFRVLFVEPGSETDFLAMTGRLDLLSELINWLERRFHHPALLGSHHAGSTIPILEENRIDTVGYITPINRAGVMMFPTQETVLSALKSAKKPIIAIKPLAGGRVAPRTALEWVYKDLRISACMIGVGSEREAAQDLSLAHEILGSM